MVSNSLLRAKLEDIRHEGDGSRRGRRFEDWLRKLFTSEGLNCGPPEESRVKGTAIEEIDGWFRDRSGLKYIVEARWRMRKFGQPDAYVFNQKLRHRPKTWGAVFSMSGFTAPATTWLATEGAEPRVVLFGPRDIETILRQDVNVTFRALLKHKREQRERQCPAKKWRLDVDGSDIRRLDTCEVRCFDAGSAVYRLLVDPSGPEGRPTLLAATHAGIILRVDARDLSPLGEIVVGPDPVRGLWIADIDGDGRSQILTATKGYASRLNWDGSEVRRYELAPGERAMGICAVQRDSGEWLVVVGAEQGHVVAYSACGDVIWRYTERTARAYDVRPCYPTQGAEPVLVVARKQGVDLLSTQGAFLRHYEVGGFVRSVACADIDGDGHQEVVIPAGDQHVHVLADDGTRKWKDPTPLSARLRCAAVGDFDGDRCLEVIAGADDGSMTALEADTGLIKWRHSVRGWIGAVVTGREVGRPAPKRRQWIASGGRRICLYEMRHVKGLPEEPRREDLVLPPGVEMKWHIDSLRYSVWAPDDRAFALRCADIDGDGSAELVAATQGGLFVFRDCPPQLVLGYGCPTTFRAVDVGDVNRNGHVAVVAGDVTGRVHVLDGHFNEIPTLIPNVPAQIRRIVTADIDGDGAAEILVAGEDGHVHAFSAAEGASLWDHRTHKLDWVRCAAVADINGDQELEIVFDADDSCIQAVDASGRPLWRASPCAPAQHAYFWDVAVLDIDGDGRMEVLSPREDGLLFAFDGQTGEEKWVCRPAPHPIHMLACYDTDGDGRVELLGACQTGIYAIKDAHTWRHFGIGRVGALGIGDYDGDGEDEVIAHVAGHGILGLRLTW